MLSAHQPFQRFPDLIKDAARENGATAQVAGGVPAMCDGVTKAKWGWNYPCFRVMSLPWQRASRCHTTHLTPPFTWVSAIKSCLVWLWPQAHSVFAQHLFARGSYASGLPNDEKAKVRQQFAKGEVGRDELMRAEMASYHSPAHAHFTGQRIQIRC